jgi:uncharacterized membrane protein YgcG
MRRSSRSIRAGILFAVLVAPIGPSTAAAGALASESVRDGAALMSQDQSAEIAEHHGYLLQDYDIDYRVLTAADVGDISHFAVRQFADLGVGEASATGRGLLLVIDPVQDRVRRRASIPMPLSLMWSTAKWCPSFAPSGWPTASLRRPS